MGPKVNFSTFCIPSKLSFTFEQKLHKKDKCWLIRRQCFTWIGSAYLRSSVLCGTLVIFLMDNDISHTILTHTYITFMFQVEPHPAGIQPNCGYTEVFHNDNDFVLLMTTELSVLKQGAYKTCISCGIDFQCNSPVSPHDLCLSHRERWEYHEHKPGGGKTKKSSRKETTKYVCCKLRCVRQRYPYFWNKFVTISNAIKKKLTTTHKLHLKTELDITFNP